MSRRYKRFSASRVFALSTRVLKQFTRDRRTLGMIIIFPIMFMLVFGVVLSGEVKHVPIRIEVADTGVTNPFTNETVNIGEDILDSLVANDRVEVELASYSESIDMVEAAEIEAAVLIPENFTQDLTSTGNATIKVYYDGTKPQLKASVFTALTEAFKDLSKGGIDFEEIQAFGVGELSGFDVGIPAVMGYILTFLILLLSVLTAIREDVNHTKTRLYTTPITPVERILGYVIALSLFAMVETTIVIAIAIYVFGATVHGNIYLLFGAGLLYGISHIFLAFLLSNFAKNELQSVQMAILIAIPSLALSGMLIPIFTFPEYLKWVAAFVPLTYGIRTFEGIMLRGWGLAELWFEFTVISVLTVVFFVLALLSSSDISSD